VHFPILDLLDEQTCYDLLVDAVSEAAHDTNHEHIGR
jgi:hypothetical protein